MGRVDRKERGWGGVDGNREGETERENLEGGNGEGSNKDGKRVAMERWAMGKGGGEDGKDATGRGEGVKTWRRAWGEEGARGGEISQMDMMGCLGGYRL